MPMSKSCAAHVLLVDDDVELTAMLSDYVRAEGFEVDALYNGADAIPAIASGIYDAVILDIMLPRMSGIEVLRLIRQTSDVPILMLTAKGDDIDRVIGLELGADDYMPKPCFPRELVARLRAVLRRRTGQYAADRQTEFRLGTLHVDVAARRVRCGERQLDLTSCEFNLLTALLRAGSRVASKEELSQRVLGRPHEAYDRSIDVHVSNLRQKLAACRAPVVIETVRGIGYRIGTGAQ